MMLLFICCVYIYMLCIYLYIYICYVYIYVICIYIYLFTIYIYLLYIYIFVCGVRKDVRSVLQTSLQILVPHHKGVDPLQALHLEIRHSVWKLQIMWSTSDGMFGILTVQGLYICSVSGPPVQMICSCGSDDRKKYGFELCEMSNYLQPKQRKTISYSYTDKKRRNATIQCYSWSLKISRVWPLAGATVAHPFDNA